MTIRLICLNYVVMKFLTGISMPISLYLYSTSTVNTVLFITFVDECDELRTMHIYPITLDYNF